MSHVCADNCPGLHDEQLLELVATLRARGTLITLDPQHDAAEKWTGESNHLLRLFPSVDVFLPNEVEICKVADALLGPPLPVGMACGPAREPVAALDDLAAAYPNTLIVLTLGAQGIKAARGADERWTEPARPATFVDATGAGDACAAAFLAQLIRAPTDVQAALRAGAAAGALCVATAGACETPITPEQLDAKLREPP